MDSSLNMIDLEYLINPAFSHIKKNILTDNHTEDIKFYRKRIFKLTKDFLCGTHINRELEDAFINYSRICIEYFKFIDKADIIQKDYPPDKEIKRDKYVHESAPNSLLMRTPRDTKITDCLPIQRKTQKKIFMPTNRHINIRAPKFMYKGLKKKNIINKYGNKKKKKEKNEKE